MSRGERRVPWPGHQKLHRGVEVTGPNPVHCIFQHEVAENETTVSYTHLTLPTILRV